MATGEFLCNTPCRIPWLKLRPWLMTLSHFLAYHGGWWRLRTMFGSCMKLGRENKLKLNPDKTEVLLFGCSSNLRDVLSFNMVSPLKNRFRVGCVCFLNWAKLEAQVASDECLLSALADKPAAHFLESSGLAVLVHALVTSDWTTTVYLMVLLLRNH